MASIFPFRAVRPTRDKVSLVSARPYGDYSQAELAAQLTYNPLSFLHVISPAYGDLQRASNEIRFGKVHQKYTEFKEELILQQDGNPSFYIHRIATPNHVFTGIIVATSIDDYKTDVIKKHEDTIGYRVDWLKDFLKFTGFNSEPVLMTYRDDASIQKWLEHHTMMPPEFEFSTTKNEIHYLWKIDHPDAIRDLQINFEALGNLYIADGHHRSASAESLHDQNHGDPETSRYFMSFLIAESNIRIYEFHRLIRGPKNLRTVDFLNSLSEIFIVEPQGQKLFQPKAKHEFGLYIEGQFFALRLKASEQNFTNAIDGLDTQILYDRVLLPLLGIKDLRHDDRIEYLPGNKPLSKLISCVDDGQFTMAFLLYPTDINEIIAVADAQLIMPPKSTYIEPKFRSGLVIYQL